MPAQPCFRRENYSFLMLPWRKLGLHLNGINDVFANSRSKSKAMIVLNGWRSHSRTLRIAPKSSNSSSLSSSRHVVVYLPILLCSQNKQTMTSIKHEKDEIQSQ